MNTRTKLSENGLEIFVISGALLAVIGRMTGQHWLLGIVLAIFGGWMTREVRDIHHWEEWMLLVAAVAATLLGVGMVVGGLLF